MSYENSNKFDSHFSNQVNTKAITDQKSSGRCWMFTGMNVLRNKAITRFPLPLNPPRLDEVKQLIASAKG